MSDRKQIRSPFIFLGQAMCLLGFGIQITNAHFAVKYFGTFFCVAGGYGMFPSLPSWWVLQSLGIYYFKTKPNHHVGFPIIPRDNINVEWLLLLMSHLVTLQDVSASLSRYR